MLVAALVAVSAATAGVVVAAPGDEMRPTAYLAAGPNPAQTGETVTFNAGDSTDPGGSIVKYEWDLDGNGTFETDTGSTATTSTSYADDGVVNVKLQVTDDDGYTSQDAQDVTITNQGPTASFTATPNPQLTGQDVSYNAGASQDPDGSIVKYEWDLDGIDGFETNSGTDKTASRYANNGNVNVRLRVTDDDGATDEHTVAVTINNRPPIATFSFLPETPVRQEQVTFNASRSTDPDGTLAEEDFQWDLDDDGTFGELGETGRTPSHTFATAGQKPVSLRVTDSDKVSDTETRTVTVQEAAPTAAFTWSPTSPLPGQTVTFTSSSTPHPGRPIASRKWDFNNDDKFDDGTGASVNHSFPTSGPKTVKLEVVDVQGGRDVETRTITVNAPPRAAFTYSPREPRTGQEVAFTSVSSDPDGPIAGYAWDLDNDGQFDDGNRVTASRVFSTPGTHIVRLRVSDTKGALATTSAAITVLAAFQPPVLAAFQPPLKLVSPFPIVRIVGRLVRGGARIRRLSVRAPAETTVTVRCRGRRCPYRKASAPARAGRSVRFRRLERRLRAGTLVEILVSHQTKIGKYTGFRIRRGRSPRRKDLCLAPGARGGSECPSG